MRRKKEIILKSSLYQRNIYLILKYFENILKHNSIREAIKCLGELKRMPDIQFQFSVIISPVFFVCGLFSNIISILILNKSEFKNQSTKTYLIITCIINIVYVTYLPFALIPAIWEINFIDCKIFLTFSLFIAEIQAWVLAFCSIDRLVFIVSPTRFLFRKNFKSAYVLWRRLSSLY